MQKITYFKDKKARALDELSRYQYRLTRQQYRTLKGQIKAGDIKGAAKGLEKLLEASNA